MSFSYMLYDSFSITRYVLFQENPLCAFTEFLMECVAKKNFKESVKILEVFKTAQLNVKVSVFLCYRGDCKHSL